MSRRLALLRFGLRRLARGLGAGPGNALAALGVMALALMLAGAFALGVGNVRGLVERVGDELTVSAWLAPGLDARAQAALASRAARIEGVRAVASLAADEALARVAATGPERAALVEALDENPLPATLEVTLRRDSRTAERVAGVRAELAALPGVEEVVGGEDWLAGYARALAWVNAVAATVGVVLALATVVIVASTIRLAQLARRDELEILALVGASRATLRLPFLLEGALLGAVAGGFAWLVLWGLFALARPRVASALAFAGEGMPLAFLGVGESVALVAAGALLGLLGAALSLRAGRHA